MHAQCEQAPQAPKPCDTVREAQPAPSDGADQVTSPRHQEAAWLLATMALAVAGAEARA